MAKKTQSNETYEEGKVKIVFVDNHDGDSRTAKVQNRVTVIDMRAEGNGGPHWSGTIDEFESFVFALNEILKTRAGQKIGPPNVF